MTGQLLTKGPYPVGLWDFRLAMPDGVTFSRAGLGPHATFLTGAGIIAAAAADMPRLDHNPATLAPLGLLLEPHGTNLLLMSTALEASPWTSLGGITVTTNADVGPDGQVSADRLSKPATGEGGRNQTVIIGNDTAPRCASIWVKNETASVCRLGLFYHGGSNTVVYDIMLTFSTGAVALTVGSSQPIASGIDPYPNGWYRLWVAAANSGTGNNAASVQIRPTNSSGSALGNILVWGAQLEAGSSPTTHIPTATSAAVRTADGASLALSQTCDLLVADSGGSEWRDGLPAGPLILTPRSGRRQIGRVLAFPAGILSPAQKAALGGILP